MGHSTDFGTEIDKLSPESPNIFDRNSDFHDTDGSGPASGRALGRNQIGSRRDAVTQWQEVRWPVFSLHPCGSA